MTNLCHIFTDSLTNAELKMALRVQKVFSFRPGTFEKRAPGLICGHLAVLKHVMRLDSITYKGLFPFPIIVSVFVIIKST